MAALQRVVSLRGLLRELLRSPEPSLRWRARVRVLREPLSSPGVRALGRQIRVAPRTLALLAHRTRPHRPGTGGGIYRYWQGSHWVLASLADLGYPVKDPLLAPMRDRTVEFWTRPVYHRTHRVTGGEDSYRGTGVPVIQGRARRCASQQGNALLSSLVLGFSDERTATLAQLLQRWQWPDGGWNCDRHPEAHVSSFHETLHAMLALRAYSDHFDDRRARKASDRAAEVFLSRRLYQRRRDGRPMSSKFLQLHYPRYWHYDILGGLVAMAHLGKLADPRCRDALDWLEGAELPRGGWPAHARYYRVSPQWRAYGDSVDWGAPTTTRSNPWVTADALHVLRAAGRFDA